ncbi:MAG: hypothetical protein COY66_00120 [Candidatus Kerfeldbacteria bacterium CG_4_10_14_0_8_um_filter_42_10]|uniref:Type 4a pilus biogenesis protein PilO n=1 Tax=Candidatus Kerfeldbacteria bacterium CG_4_10_14_0_8_um_filter_42_10 TaxID=2014248 RepID=A0A2M7RKK9_9BACT|nr:MAG: hypothetical protein COY66_00120 [Candidatus Kerfeldbacteria bacterium CG_4_10_14_0_8_um_filter_42_10]
MKITPKIKLYILISFLFVVIAVIIIFIIFPFQKKIRLLSQNIYDQRVNYEFIFQQRQNVVRLEREIKEIELNKEKIAPALFSRNETLELITALETLSQNNGLENQVLNLSNPSLMDSGLMISSLRIDFTTTYPGLVKWMQDIDKQSFYLIIDSINAGQQSTQINNGDFEAAGNNPISVNISAKVYWL